MYQALYRKYRPRRFDDVAGQTHITQTLQGQVVSGRTTHAYLFVGTRGTGKTTCARILSRAVNCLSPKDGNPCNECASCTGIENGTILDVLELDAASNNGVDDVRAMRDEAIYSPAAVKKRVYIIDEVHMLSTPAFNALLKILEEPPEHILFILATTELHKVPPTILSRCQRFTFKRLTADEISQQLCKIAESEGLTLKPDGVSVLAGLADGSMRDAVSLLDQCSSDKPIDIRYVQETLGLAANEDLIKIVEAIAGYDTQTLLTMLDRLYKDGKDMAALLGEISEVLRDLLVIKLAPGSTLISSSIQAGELKNLSKKLTPEHLLSCLEITGSTMQNTSRTGITRITMELCLVRMSDERISDGIAAQAAHATKPEADFITAAVSAPAAGPEEKPAPAAEAQEPLPEQSIEPAPIPDHEPAEEPEPSLTFAGEDGDEASDDVLAELLTAITDNSLRVMLDDSRNAEAAITDGVLVIYLPDSFEATMMENTFMEQLKEAAAKVYKRDMIIRIEVKQSTAAEEQKSKLEKLMAFDIVTTE